VKKRKPILTDDLIADYWGVLPPTYDAGGLKDFDKLIASAVSRCLAEAKESRPEIAAELSSILGESVSKSMLDAYSSHARREHPINVHRFLALIMVLGQWDILDAVVRQIGGKVITGHDLKALRVGKALIRRELDNRELDQALTAALGSIR